MNQRRLVLTIATLLAAGLSLGGLTLASAAPEVSASKAGSGETTHTENDQVQLRSSADSADAAGKAPNSTRDGKGPCGKSLKGKGLGGKGLQGKALGHKGSGRKGLGLGLFRGGLADVVARLTGLSVDDVRERRKAGESLASIAASKGVGESEVVAEASKAVKAKLDAKVSDGDMTAEERAEKLEAIEERIETALRATGELRGPGGGKAKGWSKEGCGSGECEAGGACGKPPAATAPTP